MNNPLKKMLIDVIYFVVFDRLLCQLIIHFFINRFTHF